MHRTAAFLPTASDRTRGLPTVEIVTDLDMDRRHTRRDIAAVRDDLVYNFGNAALAAARQLQELLQCL